MGKPREAGDAHLNPRVTGDHLRLRQPEVLHDPNALRVRTEVGMPETGPSILICVGKRKFVSDRVLLQKTERVSNANVVVRLGKQSWPVKIRSEHDVQVGAGARVLSFCRARRLRLILSS